MLLRLAFVVAVLGSSTTLLAQAAPRRAAKSRAQLAAFRAVTLTSQSPSGRDTFVFSGGVVTISGEPVRRDGLVQVIGTPAWRSDGEAVAWLEHERGETRLVVVPALHGGRIETMNWPLPRNLPTEKPHWSGPHRVVVGPSVFFPRAVASWSEELETPPLDTPKGE